MTRQSCKNMVITSHIQILTAFLFYTHTHTDEGMIHPVSFPKTIQHIQLEKSAGLKLEKL